MTSRMIFHVPYPLEYANPKGGGVRPTRMLRAFEDITKVELVAGTAAERKVQMARIKRLLAAGMRFDYCYSESSTMPTALTESHHLPTHPLLDFAFFAHLRRHQVPVGLFYRDIHWRFPVYGRGLNPAKKAAALAMYRFDLAAYARTVDVLFLPSLAMAEEFPAPNVELTALPPGHEVVEPAAAPVHDRLQLLYVGGLGENYRLNEFLKAVQQTPQVDLTLCTRAQEWAAHQAEYAPLLGSNVTVVHRSSEGLAPLFAAAHIGVMATEPVHYWRFAAPLKMYEYLGNGLPALASQGSMAAEFTASHGTGWTCPYRAEDFAALLDELSQHRHQVAQVRERVLEVRQRHGWKQRAEQVAHVLTRS